MMDIRQLKNFLRIVELGSFSRAAREIYIAQPALSKQIASLEQELKVPLLIRNVQGVRPTEAGLKVYQAAQSVVWQLDRLRQEVSSDMAMPSGSVSVGIPSSLAVTLGIPLLRELRRRYPGITLQLIESAGSLLKELVLQGRVDMVILVNQSTSKNLVVRKLLVGDLFLTSPLGRRSVAKRISNVRLSDFGSKPYVLPRRSVPLRQRIDALFSSAGVEPRVVAEIDAVVTLKSAVEEGLGWTILPGYALNSHEDRLIIRRIVDPPVAWEVSLCTTERLPSRPAVSAVLDLLPSIVADLIEGKSWPRHFLEGSDMRRTKPVALSP